MHLILANILVGAKHFGSKSLILTHKLCAEMLRPCQNEMHPWQFHNSDDYQKIGLKSRPIRTAFSTTCAPSEIVIYLGRYIHGPTSVWYGEGIRQDLKTYPWTGGKYTPKTFLRRYDYTRQVISWSAWEP